MSKSDISSNLSHLNFDELKFKEYSGNTSIDFENQNFEDDQASIMKIRKSLSKNKSTKTNFPNDIIDLINKKDIKKNFNDFESHQDNTKDSIILNLDDQGRREDKRKYSQSSYDLHNLVKNFHTNFNLDAKDKNSSKRDINLNVNCNNSGSDGVNSHFRNLRNSKSCSRNSSDNSIVKRNFIPKSEFLQKINNIKEEQGEKSSDIPINPFVS